MLDEMKRSFCMKTIIVQVKINGLFLINYVYSSFYQLKGRVHISENYFKNYKRFFMKLREITEQSALSH